jgi:hypothetical protein
MASYRVATPIEPIIDDLLFVIVSRQYYSILCVHVHSIVHTLQLLHSEHVYIFIAQSYCK